MRGSAIKYTRKSLLNVRRRSNVTACTGGRADIACETILNVGFAISLYENIAQIEQRAYRRNRSRQTPLLQSFSLTNVVVLENTPSIQTIFFAACRKTSVITQPTAVNFKSAKNIYRC